MIDEQAEEVDGLPEPQKIVRKSFDEIRALAQNLDDPDFAESGAQTLLQLQQRSQYAWQL